MLLSEIVVDSEEPWGRIDDANGEGDGGEERDKKKEWMKMKNVNILYVLSLGL
jgi:hypothetical protein